MTRIVAGTAGGRALKVPPSGTRPTTERVREALFSRLEHWGVVRGAHVLDLYAGTGALGLEAASRGAARVELVEAARPATTLLQKNAAALGLAQQCRVVPAKVETHVAALAGTDPRFDLVFLDPPYDLPAASLDQVLAGLAAPGVLHPDAVVVVERDKRTAAPTWPDAWEDTGVKTYGDTTVFFARPALDPDETSQEDA